MPITLRAPAKINLYLRVFPRARDGFHPLRSWFRTIELFDEVTIRLSAAEAGAQGLDLKFSSSGLAVPHGARNLAVQAAQSILGPGPIPAELDLEKRIPVGAGLGGGSSDAAAALAAVARLAPESATPTRLSELAAHLGSDVPFFLAHQLENITDTICTGRGEILQPFKPGRRHVVLLILPELQISTAEAYKRFDELPAPPEDGEPDFAAWSHLPAVELLPLLRNDLETASVSLHPELATLRQEAERLLRRPVRMTGSGSALFTLYDDREAAEAALARVAAAGTGTLLA